jgi:hypothetical protein
MCVQKLPSQKSSFLPGNGARKLAAMFDGTQLMREVILLRSPATAPEN